MKDRVSLSKRHLRKTLFTEANISRDTVGVTERLILDRGISVSSTDLNRFQVPSKVSRNSAN